MIFLLASACASCSRAALRDGEALTETTLFDRQLIYRKAQSVAPPYGCSGRPCSSGFGIMEMNVRTLVIYYSRTGTTAAVATALAPTLKADVQEIHCEKYGMGALRYLWAGYDSVKGNLPEIEMPAFNANDYDLLLLGTPIWTSYPALPVRAFLAKKPDLPARFGLFLTYGGHSPPAKAITHIKSALTQPIEDTLALNSKDIKDGALRVAAARFARGLKGNATNRA